MADQLSNKELFEGAARLMNDHGFDFRAPWECDLDDREREHYDALSAVVEFVASEAIVKIKLLRWRKPTDSGGDLGHEDCICLADGIGGKYSIQKSAEKFLLWMPYDEFVFVEHAALADAKADAEKHWQHAVNLHLLCEAV